MDVAFYPLHNPVKHYAWGSTERIARFQHRRFPTPQPEAEVWMGAHPSDSSMLQIAGRRCSLWQAVADNPEYWLGSQVARDFDRQFPFLLKILAAEKALSIQVHPTRDQAERGFRFEEQHAVPHDAPHRIYRDRNHKPEQMVALSEFQAMCGFRTGSAIAQRMRPLHRYTSVSGRDEQALQELWSVLEMISSDTDGIGSFFRTLMALQTDHPAAAAALLHGGVQAASAELAEIDAFAAAWVRRLSRQFPDDPGALAPLYLNTVSIYPGEALTLAAGIPHAYLDGLGVEVMANSDNVIRAGLTVKHIDVPSLVDTVRCRSFVPDTAGPQPVADGVEQYPQVFREFALFRLTTGPVRITRDAGCAGRGPRILLADSDAQLRIVDTQGRWEDISGGSAVVIPHATEEFRLQGTGCGYLATAGAV
ncbi:mannose-6-phosphate isomerase, class I [Spirochaeta africana]|uniref:mannose-6-phosphate isomerase n=1 Tax=Spirochaeta africana (strain ATCC 700263 / DSM 8902 / Z-7692) TaxID=889378 RepID=H9UIB5_SPIAZ|nr:mannose-6-phosphate isomerase, class I [Spirochaeta africana]AFG37258.1 mannose-6-phosphate isomerase, class I [Spirochaeta africana DSM 8902]